MSEDYVRPPIVALELPSQRAAVWRFRIIVGAILLLIGVAIVLIAHAIISANNNDGGGTVGLGQAQVLLTALR